MQPPGPFLRQSSVMLGRATISRTIPYLRGHGVLHCNELLPFARREWDAHPGRDMVFLWQTGLNARKSRLRSPLADGGFPLGSSTVVNQGQLGIPMLTHVGREIQHQPGPTGSGLPTPGNDCTSFWDRSARCPVSPPRYGRSVGPAG